MSRCPDRRTQGDSWQQPGVNSRKSRCGKRMLSINCIDELAFVPLAPSQLLELSPPHRDQAGRRAHHVRLADTALDRGSLADQDPRDMLDTFAALLRLIGVVIAGTAKLAAFLIRKLVAAWKPQA